MMVGKGGSDGLPEEGYAMAPIQDHVGIVRVIELAWLQRSLLVRTE